MRRAIPGSFASLPRVRSISSWMLGVGCVVFSLLVLPSSTAAQGTMQAPCDCYNPDQNNDNAITITDLLALLALFGQLDSDGDGLWNPVDGCNGIVDACGVCGGSGPSVPVYGEVTYLTDSVFVEACGVWQTFTIPIDTAMTYVCPVPGCIDSLAFNFDPAANVDDGSCTFGPAQCGGLSTVTFDGHTYALVGIGTQCWFAENLRSDNYLNGDAIPGDLTGGEWTSTTIGAQTVYGEGLSQVEDGEEDEALNLAIYGRLYNRFAVSDARGVCPSGFYVPGDAEWFALEQHLGGASIAGTKLKVSPQDSPSWDGDNSSGFAALPAGDRGYYVGNFHNQGGLTHMWTSSQNGTAGWSRHLLSGNESLLRDYYDPHYGFSIRCIKHAEPGTCFDPDNDGVCAEDEISGCTDISASNFNPAATENDGTCLFAESAQCGSSSIVTFDGHTYDLVGIGTQCWFKENLRADNYLNGDVIPGNLTDEQWTSAMSGAQAIYGEGISEVVDGSDDEISNLELFGRLYNLYVVNDARGVCPSGFHVPSDTDWNILENHLGGPLVAGMKLKASPQDSLFWDGINTSGFSAVPTGIRGYYNGVFSHQGSLSQLWTFSQNGSTVWSRSLLSETGSIQRDYFDPHYGFAIRCLKDAEPGTCFDPDNDGVCAEDEVSGCTEDNALNFDPSATEDDGSCTFGPAQCGGASSVTFDGHTYALVGIGTQCWFAENLRSDNYRNGDPIPGNLTDAQWTSTTSGAQAVYGEGTSVVYAGSSDEVMNLETYGRLYNWYAVNDARGLCPSGFHLPSDVEWTSLTNSLGGASTAGGALKSLAPAWDGNNSSGFSGLPGGYRNSSYGYFNVMIVDGYWWSATPNGGYAWGRALHSGLSSMNRYSTHPKRDGFSVRCIRD
jgi:uncharacterized protein (TIGR02145 family)